MAEQLLELHPDRFLGTTPESTAIAREIYAATRELPIISPHGHTDAAWFADNRPFSNATELLLVPDHYVLRMLYSQGFDLSSLGVESLTGDEIAAPRAAWRLFAANYHLFLGTPCRIWLDHVFHEVFGLDIVLNEDSADHYYAHIEGALQMAEYLPRAILDRFAVERIATTEGALDPLLSHQRLHREGLGERILSTFRPDDVVDPDRIDFAANVAALGELTGEDTQTWAGYLQALRSRREFFKSLGVRASDHGHPSAATADLDVATCERLLRRCLSGEATSEERELFRAQMLTEMASMSLDDGLVMQLHPGSVRNHNSYLHRTFGPDKGADIPCAIDFVNGLRPLLDRVGNDPRLTLILFTLDESTYARELAPLAGHYPCLKLGPPWWFHDSPEGMLRFRQQTTETAGFYNTVGFNDDTRALLSIPARHDLARRMDARFLADWVAQHRLTLEQASGIAIDLAYGLAKRAYGFDRGRI